MFSSTRLRKLPLFFYLSVSYLILYAVCALLLYVINIRVISHSARAFDREDVESESREYAEILRNNTSGDWLAEEIALENFPESTLFAIRVFGTDGKVAYSASHPKMLAVPGGWAKSAETDARPVPRAGWKKVYLQDYNRYLQIKTTRLGDGRTMQVAKSTDLENVQRRILTHTSAIFIVLASLFTVANGFWMMLLTVGPIKRISGSMAKIIQTGTLEHGIDRVGSPIAELNSLGEYFNLMTRKNATLIKAMRDTLDNVAHDFRTPLARIRGAAEFAINAHKPTPDNEALLGTLADIIDDCDNARTQLQNLMDIREMESGCVKLDIRPLDAKQMAAEIADLYAVLAEDKNIMLTLALPDAPVPMSGDKNRLSQMLANLVDNAVKYTPNGGRIRLALDADETSVRFTISDTGIGIPEEEHALIWQRLFRSRNARHVKGLGLGMSIVKAIVDAHRGSITFTSVPDQGTTFILTLPRQAQPIPPASDV